MQQTSHDLQDWWVIASTAPSDLQALMQWEGSDLMPASQSQPHISRHPAIEQICCILHPLDWTTPFWSISSSEKPKSSKESFICEPFTLPLQSSTKIWLPAKWAVDAPNTILYHNSLQPVSPTCILMAAILFTGKSTWTMIVANSKSASPSKMAASSRHTRSESSSVHSHRRANGPLLLVTNQACVEYYSYQNEH